MDHKEQVEAQMKQLKEIRRLAGMNRREFSEYFGIPQRTLEDWEAGKRKAPDYVVRLISYRVRMEKMLDDNQVEREDFYDK